jgi:hypothetical protein
VARPAGGPENDREKDPPMTGKTAGNNDRPGPGKPGWRPSEQNRIPAACLRAPSHESNNRRTNFQRFALTVLRRQG